MCSMLSVCMCDTVCDSVCDTGVILHMRMSTESVPFSKDHGNKGDV